MNRSYQRGADPNSRYGVARSFAVVSIAVLFATAGLCIAAQREGGRQAASSPAATISKEQAATLVDEFQTTLRQRWSYYPYSAAEIDAAIAALREQIGPDTSFGALALEFQKVIAHGIDGHARVSGWRLDGGYLPFLIESSGDRFVACTAMRTKFLAEDHPFIVSIDGRPIADWLAGARQLVAKGSPDYVKSHALRQLRRIDHWRGEMGLPQGGPLEVVLSSRDGSRTTKVSLPVAGNPPATSDGPPRLSRVLPDNIGFLRLESMNSAAVAEIKNWMPQFRATEGLVVDVRDNGGGSRDALRELFSYLMAENDPPRVINCAKYRLHASFRDDHLISRFLYPATSERWTNREREAITQFRESFRPAWELPVDEFSDWHYMVLSRLDVPEIYHYSKPVVVLLNARCFSATDVFLAGLKGWRNVTLLGTPSGGGSARIVPARLANSPISVALGSMVSFMPNGLSFDGNGVEPDIRVEPSPEYFIGGTDNALERAREIIRDK